MSHLGVEVSSTITTVSSNHPVELTRNIREMTKNNGDQSAAVQLPIKEEGDNQSMPTISEKREIKY